MKKDIHPQYYPQAQAVCACGNKFTVGSTKPEIFVEICAACHPFYTGKEKLVDTAGRVEKFRQRAAKKKEMTAKGSQAGKKPKAARSKQHDLRS